MMVASDTGKSNTAASGNHSRKASNFGNFFQTIEKANDSETPFSSGTRPTAGKVEPPNSVAGIQVQREVERRQTAELNRKLSIFDDEVKPTPGKGKRPDKNTKKAAPGDHSRQASAFGGFFKSIEQANTEEVSPLRWQPSRTPRQDREPESSGRGAALSELDSYVPRSKRNSVVGSPAFRSPNPSDRQHAQPPKRKTAERTIEGAYEPNMVTMTHKMQSTVDQGLQTLKMASERAVDQRRQARIELESIEKVVERKLSVFDNQPSAYQQAIDRREQDRQELSSKYDIGYRSSAIDSDTLGLLGGRERAGEVSGSPSQGASRGASRADLTAEGEVASLIDTIHEKDDRIMALETALRGREGYIPTPGKPSDLELVPGAPVSAEGLAAANSQLRRELNNMRQELQTRLQEKANALEVIEGLKTRAKTAEMDQMEQMQQMRTLQQQADGARQKLVGNLRKEVAELESKCANLKQERDNALQTVQMLRDECVKYTEDVNRMQAEMERYKSLLQRNNIPYASVQRSRSSDLRALESHNITSQNKRLQNEIVELKAEIRRMMQAQNQGPRKSKGKEMMKLEVDAFQSEAKRLQMEIERSRSQVDAMSQENAKLRRESQLFQRREGQDTTSQIYKVANEQLTKKIEGLQNQIGSLARRQMAEKQQPPNIGSRTKSREMLEIDNTSVEQENKRLKKQVSQLKSTNTRIKRRSMQLQGNEKQAIELTARNVELENCVSDLQQNLQHVERHKSTLEEKVQELEPMTQLLSSEVVKLDEQNRNLQQHLQYANTDDQNTLELTVEELQAENDRLMGIVQSRGGAMADLGGNALHGKVKRLQQKIQKIRAVNTTLQQQLSNREVTNKEAVDAERKRAQEAYKQMTQNDTRVRRQMTMKEQEVLELTRQLNSVQNKVQGGSDEDTTRLMQKEQTILKLTRQLAERDQTISSLEAEARRLKKDQDQLKSSMEAAVREFRAEIARVKANMSTGGGLSGQGSKQLALQVQDLQQRLQHRQAEMEEARQTIAKSSEQMGAQSKRIMMLDSSIREKDGQLEALSSKIQSLTISGQFSKEQVRERDVALDRQQRALSTYQNYHSKGMDANALDAKMAEIQQLQLRLIAKTRQIEQCKPIIRRLGGEVPDTPTVDSFAAIQSVPQSAGQVPDTRLLVGELRNIVDEQEKRINDLRMVVEDVKRGKIRLAEATSGVIEELRQQLRQAAGPNDAWLQVPPPGRAPPPPNTSSAWPRGPSNYYTRFQNWTSGSRPRQTAHFQSV